MNHPLINQQIINSTCQTAKQLSLELKRQNLQIVFAESCTAGLVSAVMAGIPGISAYLCGSAATYQNETKQAWLQIDPQQILEHSSVCPQVTVAMARSVLAKTSQADLAVAITGHLQPEATEEGPMVWVGAAKRQREFVSDIEPRFFSLQQRSRMDRQWEAAELVLRMTLDVLEQSKIA